MDTRNKEDMLHVSRWWLCNQIHKHGGCTTLNWCTWTRLHHPITIDWDSTKYVRLTLKWDYKNQKIYAHIPGYIQKALLWFKHKTPKTKQNSPHPHVKPQYGAKAQCATNKDTSPPRHQQGGKICARSSRHITLLRQSSGQHNPPSTQCNCHRASKSNGEIESNSKTTVRLLCNAGRSGTCLQSKQNDSCSTQWCRILQQKEIKEPSGGAFFPIQRW